MAEANSQRDCVKCGAPFSVLRARCPTCGHVHRAPQPACPRCGRPLPRGAAQCGHCVQSAPLPEPPPASSVGPPEPPREERPPEPSPASSSSPNEEPVAPQSVGRFSSVGAYLAISVIGCTILGAAFYMYFAPRQPTAGRVPSTIADAPVPPPLKASLLALGQRVGGTVSWRGAGVFTSSDGFLIAEKGAWPAPGSEAIAAATLSGWQGTLLCALLDEPVGVAVFQARPAAAGSLPTQPLVLTTVDSQSVVGLLIVYRPALFDWRYIRMESGAPPAGIGGPLLRDAPGRESDILGILRADERRAQAVVGANELQRLLVRARTTTARPCGTLEPLPSPG